MELLKNTSLILKSIHYTHNGFVALLGFVKAKAPTDCDQIIGFFIDFIESDVLLSRTECFTTVPSVISAKTSPDYLQIDDLKGFNYYEGLYKIFLIFN